MSIGGINSNYLTGYEIRRTTRNTSGKNFDNTALGGNGYIKKFVMTMSIGGMETAMSLEISKPTEAPNEISKQDTDNNMPSADAEMDTVSDEMSNISTES